MKAANVTEASPRYPVVAVDGLMAPAKGAEEFEMGLKSSSSLGRRIQARLRRPGLVSGHRSGRPAQDDGARRDGHLRAGVRRASCNPCRVVDRSYRPGA